MTQKNGFTPGPWGISKYSPEHKGGSRMIYVASNRQPINSNICIVGSDDNPVNEANARLIAKAPEMYEALKGAVGFLEATHGLHDAVANIRAILSEIEGTN